MCKKGLILSTICLLTACTITPKPFTINERYIEANNDIKQLFAQAPQKTMKMDFYTALALSMKYNLDFRIKQVNTALQAGQLKIAEFTMFPTLNASGSVYSRANNFSSFGTTPGGAPTDVLNSTPRTIRSARIGLSWNILEFGVGYVRARQQGERVLIAEEESRRQLQHLTQDVLVAYWSAYSAQKLMIQTRDFQKLLNAAKNKLTYAMQDKSIPKESILNYQAALLDGNRRLIQLQYKYDKAMADLKHLLYLPLDQQIVLASPPRAFLQTQDLSHINLQKLDSITLVTRAELRSQNYQQRIAKFGVKTILLQALPGITFNEGWNYNSNKFLVNKIWLDHSLEIAWSLLNLASLPTSYQTAQMQVKYEQLKSMALTMTVLTETRYAFAHYQAVRQEYLIAHKQTANADAIYLLNKNRQLASLASDQQVILAKLRSIVSAMEENLLLSDLSTALGELYLSVGIDILPINSSDASIAETAELLKKHFTLENSNNFKKLIDVTYDKVFSEIKNPNPTKAAPIVIAAVNTPAKTVVASLAPVAVPNAPTKGPYTLQVYGAYDLATIKELQETLKVKLITGKTSYKGHDWYILTYGKYSTANAAKADMRALPKQLSSLKPWVRTMNDLTWLS
jgi:multidrug efflux system outer membrane protein